MSAGPDAQLVKPAARAWRALVETAKSAGIVLMVTGSYRSYTQQVDLFHQRWTTSYVSGAESVTWQGTRYYLRRGVARAAIPGTSNHGWGLAVDAAENLDSDPSAESLSRSTLQWLVNLAPKFGFSWELQSEPWHLRYVAGDDIPQSVLNWEGDMGSTPADIWEWDGVPNPKWKLTDKRADGWGPDDPDNHKIQPKNALYDISTEAHAGRVAAEQARNAALDALAAVRELESTIQDALTTMGVVGHTHDVGPAKPTA